MCTFFNYNAAIFLLSTKNKYHVTTFVCMEILYVSILLIIANKNLTRVKLDKWIFMRIPLQLIVCTAFSEYELGYFFKSQSEIILAIVIFMDMHCSFPEGFVKYASAFMSFVLLVYLCVMFVIAFG